MYYFSVCYTFVCFTAHLEHLQKSIITWNKIGAEQLDRSWDITKQPSGDSYEHQCPCASVIIFSILIWWAFLCMKSLYAGLAAIISATYVLNFDTLK